MKKNEMVISLALLAVFPGVLIAAGIVVRNLVSAELIKPSTAWIPEQASFWE